MARSWEGFHLHPLYRNTRWDAQGSRRSQDVRELIWLISGRGCRLRQGLGGGDVSGVERCPNVTEGFALRVPHPPSSAVKEKEGHCGSHVMVGVVVMVMKMKMMTMLTTMMDFD